MNGDSSIKLRIKAFFNQLHPFLYFNDAELEVISENVQISVYKKNEVIFSKGEQPGANFFVVKKGAIRIEQVENEIGFLVDKCGEGDIFGLRSVLADSEYLYNAIALEDSILYEVPVQPFSEIFPKHIEASKYIINTLSINQIERSKSDNVTLSLPSLLSNPGHKKALITTHPDSTIQSAIQRMSKHQVSSIIITNKKYLPLGIITDRDIRRFVAEGYNGELAVQSLMSAPVKCLSSHSTLAEAQLTMINSGFHHLCLTEDGTDQSACVGIITEHDILYAGATDPIVILKKIKSAETIKELKETRKKMDRLIPFLIGDQINRKITLSIMDQLNRAIIKKVGHLSYLEQKGIDSKMDKSYFSFYSMGSGARGEQIFMTDQDNGIIIHDDHKELQPAYLRLGKRINQYLNEIGYEFCPANMMAGDSAWCMTQSGYQKMIQNWIMNPGPEEVLKTAIFFDFRHEFGNQKIEQALKEFILNNLDRQDVYLRFLAAQATNNPPPTSFFRNFVVEKDGEHKDLFDIKLRAIAPLVDCARVLALGERFMIESGTVSRLEHLILKDPSNSILYENAIESFLELIAIRMKNVLSHQGNGNFIDPVNLSKVERIKLRKYFGPAKTLIEMIERKYQLAYMR